ncbi:MAG: MFS transporter [Rhodoferax sp.]
MSEHTRTLGPQATLGLAAIFGSTFFLLVAHFMLSPLLLLRMKAAALSNTAGGLFAAAGWLGIFLMTPFASTLAQRLGQRRALWASSAVVSAVALGYSLVDQVAAWFVLNFVSGAAMALRWVLAEALIAEFCPPAQRGRFVGFFQTLVSSTFILGPAALVGVGPQQGNTLGLIVAVSLFGLAWTALVPPLPTAHDAHSTRTGWQGLWAALRTAPLVMLVGFVGGFFETGVTGILPLYGLALGLDGAQAALLVSASGLGGVLMMVPAGALADRFADPVRGRLRLMQACAALMLAATALMPWVADTPALAWPLVFVWGGAGGSLYTLVMIDIGSREKGLTLVNATAVLVLTYTLGGLVASSASGVLLDYSARVAFPAALLAVAGLGLAALLLSRSGAGGRADRS